MHSKVVITYADLVWIEVLEEYWKEWKMNEAQDGGLVKFRFCDKEVQGMLSSQFGEGWKASLKADRVWSEDVAYPCRRKRDEENLEWEVCRHIYPPPFSFVVRYNSLPDCSKVASMEELIVEGTSRGSLRFPFTVYQVKTPHPPTSPSASASSSMGGHTALPSSMETGDEATAHPDAVIDGATTPPTEIAAEVLDHFRDRFIKDTASSAIMYELKHKDVISSGDVEMIERKADVTQQNQYLYECLMRKCTKEALMEVCNVMTAVRGNPKMNALGKDMRRRLKASPSLVHMVLEKYEEDFFKCVNAKLRLRRLIRRGVITDTIKGDIESANDDEAREILFDHLKQNANVDTLKEYLKVAIAADGYPNMQSLGRKMMEELQQGGEQTH